MQTKNNFKLNVVKLLACLMLSAIFAFSFTACTEGTVNSTGETTSETTSEVTSEITGESTSESTSVVTLYTATFVGGEGATGSIDPVQDQEGAKFILPANAFEKTNFVFVGWNDGTSDYAVGDEYTMPSKNVIFTAQWEEVYSVTYSIGEHASAQATVPAEETGKKSGEKVTIPAAPEAADGYVFKGWAVDGQTLEVGAEYTVTKSVTITAQWAEVYNVTFALGENAADNAVLPDQVVGKESGEKVTLPAAVDTQEHYTFVGWSDGTNTYDAGEEYTVSGTATLTAVYTLNKYLVTFDGNGATGTVPTATEYDYNSQIDLPIQGEMVKDGYNFKGWAVTNDATAPIEGKYTVTGEVTLYAVWESAVSNKLVFIGRNLHLQTSYGLMTSNAGPIERIEVDLDNITVKMSGGGTDYNVMSTAVHTKHSMGNAEIILEVQINNGSAVRPVNCLIAVYKGRTKLKIYSTNRDFSSMVNLAAEFLPETV